jgi:rod shape determining protein RodA
MRPAPYRSLRDLDWTLIFLAMAISGLGVLEIYSATLDTYWRGAWLKQIVWIGAGLVLMWVTTSIDYHTLLRSRTG